MAFLNLFHKTPKVECPRCLGKGFVDLADIERLERRLKWLPGSCAFCSGTGKVPEDRGKKVPVNTTYLSTNLSGNELRKLFRGDAKALNRAKEYEKNLDELISEIQTLHSNEGWDMYEISKHYLTKYAKSLNTEYRKKELVDFIKRVLED